MSFSGIQRRAFVIALATMVGIGAVVLCYWQAVSQGLLPSPLQPLGGLVSDAAPKPVTASARAPAPSPPALPEATFSTGASTTKAPAKASSPSTVPLANSVEAPNASLEPSVTNAALNSSTPQTAAAELHESTMPAAPPSMTSAADEKLAEHWLSNTNDRPVIRVQYDPVDILRLAELGRGVIVASSRGTAPHRELYLQSKPGAAPLFLPYTRNVADRFSSYSLSLNAAPALAQLTTAFPVYFPDSTVALAFVPDHGLATDIFVQVAKARRAVRFPVSAQMIFEGRLTREGAQPRFDLVEIRSGTERVLLSAAGSKLE